MRAGLDPFSFLVVSIAGWMNLRQHEVVEYLLEENRRPSRADRQPTHTIHCGSALPPCSESENAQPEDPRAGRDNRETGNPIGMASEIDRQEIRWQRVQNSRAATNRDGDFGSRCPYGRGKPRVGLSADSGCIIESRPRSGPHHNCRHPETSRPSPSTGEKSE